MGKIKPIPFENESEEIKDRVKAYWAKRSDAFVALKTTELASNKYERWEREISAHLPCHKPLKILDVGCGPGFFEVMLSRMGHCVTGIDMTPEMISSAEALIKQENLSAEVFVMDAENPDFDDDTFDVVISRNLTWTLPHPLEAYFQWKRVLKPGGIILNFDAEYAKGHHDKKLPEHHAHAGIPAELNEECHRIYHMLSISALSRPEWDKKVLSELGMCYIQAFENVNSRIYIEQDEFYIADSMFCIYAKKPECI